MSPRLPEALGVALMVIDALEEVGVEYQIGGSFASSVHGVPRQTNDVDLVVDLEEAQVAELARRLGSTFYLDTDRIRAAVRSRASCNLLHLDSGVKIDLFVLGTEPFDRLELERSIAISVPGSGRRILVKSPEDTILRKLWWYRLGHEASERQWSDLEGIVAVQHDRLDQHHLRRWAGQLEVEDLLDRLLRSR